MAECLINSALLYCYVHFLTDCLELSDQMKEPEIHVPQMLAIGLGQCMKYSTGNSSFIFLFVFRATYRYIRMLYFF